MVATGEAQEGSRDAIRVQAEGHICISGEQGSACTAYGVAGAPL